MTWTLELHRCVQGHRVEVGRDDKDVSLQNWAWIWAALSKYSFL